MNSLSKLSIVFYRHKLSFYNPELFKKIFGYVFHILLIILFCIQRFYLFFCCLTFFFQYFTEFSIFYFYPSLLENMFGLAHDYCLFILKILNIFFSLGIF